MEFNEQFYNRLTKLVYMKKDARLIETRKIVAEVRAYYIANGITELWQNLPGDDVAAKPDPTSEVVVRRFEKEKPMAPAPLKKDLLTSGEARASPARLTASPNVYHHSSSSNNGEKRNSSNSNDVPDLENLTESDLSQIVKSACMTSESLNSSASITSKSFDETSNASSGAPRVIIGLKRSHSEDETSRSSVISEPPIKQRKADETAAVSTEKSTNSDDDSFEALCCVVCKQLSTLSGNRMLECHECHSLYHQKCHEPNIPQSQMDDPRLLWYCNTCSKKVKKFTTSVSKPTSQGGSQTSSSKSSTTKDVGSKEKQTKFLQTTEVGGLKRNESKDNTSNRSQLSSGTSSSSVQLAAAAADFLAKHKNKTTISSQIRPSSLVVPPFAPSSSSSSSMTSGLVGLGKLAAVQHKLSSSASSSAISASSGGVSGLEKLQQMAAAAGQTMTTKLLSSPVSASSSGSTSQVGALPKTPTNLSSSSFQTAEKRLKEMKKKAQSKSSFLK